MIIHQREYILLLKPNILPYTQQVAVYGTSRHVNAVIALLHQEKACFSRKHVKLRFFSEKENCSMNELRTVQIMALFPVSIFCSF
jgi:hypothetical protein